MYVADNNVFDVDIDDVAMAVSGDAFLYRGLVLVASGGQVFNK